MRSDKPIPGNPWPHDMSITVDDRPNPLIELLWIREAHGLHVDDPDLPPLLLDTPEPATLGVDGATRSMWQTEWRRIWGDVVAHACRERDPALFDRLSQTANGSPERETLLREITGPSWGDEFGRDAFDDPSYDAWEREGAERYMASMRDLAENSPERRDLEHLVPAWRAGLTKIVSIPCRDEYTRRVGPAALLLTEGTRLDSVKYRRALTSFG